MSFQKKKKTNHSFYFLFLLALIAAISFFLYKRQSFYYTEKSIKIGLLDGERLWSELSSIKKLKEDLNGVLSENQKKFSELESSLRKENQELIHLQQDYSSKGYKLPQNFEKRQKDFSLKVMEIQRNAEEKQKQINELYEKSMTVIKKKVEYVIQKVAQRKGISLVLYYNQAAYHEPGLDITEEVFEELKDFHYTALR